MVEREGIAKTEAWLAGAQRYSHGMGSIGQRLGTRTIAASGDIPSALAMAGAAIPASGWLFEKQITRENPLGYEDRDIGS